MPAYTLQFARYVAGPTITMGSSLSFDAADDESAILALADISSARLEACDEARLVDHDGSVIWRQINA